jgi:flagellar basal body-associated protein FliL
MEKSKLMMIIIIALLVLLLGTVVGVSLYALKLFNENSDPEARAAANQPQVVKNLTREQITSVSLGDPITTNLQKGDDGKSHFAILSVEVGYDNTVKNESDAFGLVLAENIKYARSVALSCIYGRKYEELQDMDGLNELAAEILQKLQEGFNSQMIVEVTISDQAFQ